MNKDLLNALDTLSKLNPLIDFNTVWVLVGSYVDPICGISLAMTFAFMLIDLLMGLLRGQKPFTWASASQTIVRALLIGAFFGIPQVYRGWTALFTDMVSYFTQALSTDSFISFQAHFRAYLYGVQNTASESVGASVKFLNPLNWVVTYVNQFVIGAYYFLETIGPVMMLMCLFLGPLCAAFSIILPGVGRNWVSFFLSALFFNAIVGIAMITIGDTGLLQIVSGFSFVNSQIVALIILFTILIFFAIVPITIATIFGVHFYGFISNIFGVTLGAMGLLPLAIQSIGLSRVVKIIDKLSKLRNRTPK